LSVIVPKYLLDENVIREMQRHKNVKKWLKTVDDSELAICLLTLFEKRVGAERQKEREPEKAARQLAAIEAFEERFNERTFGLDQKTTADWAAFVGKRDKHRMDAGIAATAKRHGLVVVTRNIRDFSDFNVDCLDPFRDPPLLVRRLK
jgi:hypothetical protein